MPRRKGIGQPRAKINGNKNHYVPKEKSSLYLVLPLSSWPLPIASAVVKAKAVPACLFARVANTVSDDSSSIPMIRRPTSRRKASLIHQPPFSAPAQIP